MNELRIHVERAVRPIRATEATKLKMREELFAHLTAIYEEERARGADEPTAVALAKERIGTAAELTAELDATIPRNERWGAALERHLGRSSAKSDTHYVLRISCCYAAFLLVVSTVVPLVLCLTQVDGHSYKSLGEHFLHRTRYALPILAWVQVNISAIVFIEVRLSTARRVMRVALWSTAGGLIVWATSGLLLWSLTGEMSAAIDAMKPSPWLLLAVVVGSSIAAVTGLHAREKAKLAPWVELELGD